MPSKGNKKRSRSDVKKEDEEIANNVEDESNFVGDDEEDDDEMQNGAENFALDDDEDEDDSSDDDDDDEDDDEEDEPKAKKPRVDKTARQSFPQTATSSVLLKNIPYSASEAQIFAMLKATAGVQPERLLLIGDRMKDALLCNVRCAQPEEATTIVETVSKSNLDMDGNILEASLTQAPFTSEATKALFVSGFSPAMTEKEVKKKVFAGHKPKRLDLMKHKTDNSIPPGAYAEYEDEESAVSALNALVGREMDGLTLYARHSRPKVSRPADPNAEGLEDTRAVNVKNISWSVQSNDLFKEFMTCGQIVEVRVLRDVRGVNSGVGRVLFETAEAAKNAVQKHGAKVGGSKIEVTLAKEYSTEKSMMNQIFNTFEYRSQQKKNNRGGGRGGGRGGNRGGGYGGRGGGFNNRRNDSRGGGYGGGYGGRGGRRGGRGGFNNRDRQGGGFRGGYRGRGRGRGRGGGRGRGRGQRY